MEFIFKSLGIIHHTVILYNHPFGTPRRARSIENIGRSPGGGTVWKQRRLRQIAAETVGDYELCSRGRHHVSGSLPRQ